LRILVVDLGQSAYLPIQYVSWPNWVSLFLWAGFPILMAVFREERDDLEMVRHAFLPYMVSEGYLFPNIIFSSSPLRVGIRSFSLSIMHYFWRLHDKWSS
jgi:hypothetical protein